MVSPLGFWRGRGRCVRVTLGCQKPIVTLRDEYGAADNPQGKRTHVKGTPSLSQGLCRVGGVGISTRTLGS